MPKLRQRFRWLAYGSGYKLSGMLTERQSAAGAVRFDDFELRLEEAGLFRHGRRLKLQPQPFRLLAYLISRSPEIVSKEDLGEHIWEAGVHVDLDQSISYCIRQIRQVLDDSATLPRYVETLPRQGYRFICPIEIGADLPAEQPAEPSEPIPEPGRPQRLKEEQPVLQELVEEADVAKEALSRLDARRKIELARPRLSAAGWAASAAVILAALSLLAWSRHLLPSFFHSQRVASVAVLPLENLSGDQGQEYVADGMTDELITMLARDSTLRVVSRTSVMQYKGARQPLPEVARALGVDAVVEGSLSRSGSRMHMTLQLIRADTDSHLWAESYDRDANDGSLPDEAARSIAKRLNSVVSSPGPARAINPAAHDAYLRGRYLWPTFQMGESGAYFRKATEIQPDYAEAWAMLSSYYGEGVAGGALDPRTNLRLQEEAAERALLIAPNLALAHQAMSAVYLIGQWDWKRADREILLAINLDPSDAESYYLRACVLEAENRFPEAIELEKKSMEMDPFERRDALASLYLYARLYDEALADIKMRMETAPKDPGLLYTSAEVWRRMGNYKEAVGAWAKMYEVIGYPQAAAGIRRAFERGGAKGTIRWQLEDQLKDARSHYVSPVHLASLYAQLGDKEHALDLLEEGYKQRSTDILWINDDPAFDFLHQDTRYQAIIQKVGQPATS